MKKTNTLKIALVSVAAILFTVVYFAGAEKHSREVNLDYNAHDQGAYMYYAQQLHDTHYHFTGDRNRHPLFPLIMSVFYSTGTPLDVFFSYGKTLNIAFSLLMLSVLLFIFKKFFNLHAAFNLFFITAFTVFIFKAPYFQCELLYYFMAFLTLLLFIQMFIKPTWYYALLVGLFTGLTFLAKASIMPALSLFAFWFVIQQMFIFIKKFKARKTEPVRVLSVIMPFINIALVFITFILVIYPYISTSKRIFGKYFYNVNSTFYMWYDSREEIKSGTRAYGDRSGWPDMPAELIPSSKKYLREHSVEHIINRIVSGGITSIKAAKRAYGYFWFLFFYLIYFIGMVVINWRKSLQLARDHFFLLMYLLSYFGAFFVLNAWWNYLGPSVRHILALFLPFMFLTSLIISQFPKNKIKFLSYNLNIQTVFNVFISVYLSIEVYIILTSRLYILSGGA